MIQFFKDLNPRIKVFSCFGIILMLYRWLAGAIPLYFFWESGTVGYFMLTASIGVILVVELLIKIGILKEYYRSGWRTAFLILYSLLFTGIHLQFYFSDAFENAKLELKSNPELLEEVGEIESFGPFVSGSSSGTSTLTESNTSIRYSILVKGKKAFKDVSIDGTKYNDEPWQFEIW